MYMCIGREGGVEVPVVPSLLSCCIFLNAGAGACKQNEDLDFFQPIFEINHIPDFLC